MRLASVNVNGVRAAYKKGMGEWVAGSGADIITLQEVRAETPDLEHLVDAGWHISHDPCSEKGRAGVAVLSTVAPRDVRAGLGPDSVDTSGRWLEVDVELASGVPVTVVSAYVHSGEVGSPKQERKYEFLEFMDARMKELGATGHHVVVTGDLNIGHRWLDIKNWKGNVKNSGFLPEERAYLDKWLGHEDDQGYNTGSEGRFVDVGRAFAGEVEGPYAWWSYRGRAFDNDTGWRIDYHLATPALASTVTRYWVDRAPSYDTRWSDHAPVVADYDI